MIILLWEDANNCINSIVGSLSSKFPKDAQFYLSKRPEAAEIEKLTKPPFVFAGWLIYANAKTSVKILQQLDESRSKNIILLRVNNQRDFKDTEQRIAMLNYQSFDNHALEKTTILTWIQQELVCSEAIAKYIYNRTGGYLKNLIFAVQTLKRSNKEIDRKLIRSLVEKSQNASMMDIAEYLIGIENSYTDIKDIYSTLYKFRYAESWLLETLKKELSNYIKVYQLVSDCTLDISNYLTNSELLQDKQVRDLPKWKLKRIILNYGKASLERIILTTAMLNSFGSSNFDLIKLLQLVQVGGS